MIIFPFIEKIAEWVKNQGGFLYWIWVISVGSIGAVTIKVWAEYGFDEARWPLGIFIIVYLGFMYPVKRHEEKRKQGK